jgi:hypothetical protein
MMRPEWRDHCAAADSHCCCWCTARSAALAQLPYPEGCPIGRINIAVSRQAGNDYRASANEVTRFGRLPSAAGQNQRLSILTSSKSS